MTKTASTDLITPETTNDYVIPKLTTNLRIYYKVRDM